MKKKKIIILCYPRGTHGFPQKMSAHSDQPAVWPARGNVLFYYMEDNLLEFVTHFLN